MEQNSECEHGMDFPTTRWTLIRQASGQSGPDARKALEELCQSYAGPVLAFIRRRVVGREEAEDATQEFFSRLLAGSLLDRADPVSGQFRAFLLNAVRNFLSDQWDYQQAQKRGGGVRHVALDEINVPASRSDLSPEDEFEIQWARTILQRSLDRLMQEYILGGKEPLWLALQTQLDQSSVQAQQETAERLRMSHGALRVALHRMRKRLGELIRDEVAHTVPDTEDVEEELQRLRSVLEKSR
ncbi:MAG: sigma-70 family RNA polymerase sigma factor [Planctomycetaceae bacterium]|nr:sigma-70 family RNA polymerase sigma factor [Planctomycetaceae bacterium]